MSRRQIFTNYAVGRDGAPHIDVELSGGMMTLVQLFDGGRVSRIIVSDAMISNLITAIQDTKHEQEAYDRPTTATEVSNNPYRFYGVSLPASTATANPYGEDGGPIIVR